MDGNISSAGESNQGAPGKVMRSGRLWLFAAVLVVVGLFFFWPLVFHTKHLVPFHVLLGDPALAGIDAASDRPDWTIFDDSPVTIFYSEKSLAAKELHDGLLPLWNPYNGLGISLLADGQSQPFAPFFLPFMVHPTPWVYSWMLLLQLLFGGLGAALLLRKLGMGMLAQTFAGLLFAFNPYALNYLIYSNVWAYVWFPWVFLCAERWVRKERGVFLTALSIALMAMSGHVEVAFFGAVSVFAYLAVRFFQEGTWRRNLSRLIVLPFLTVALSAWWLLPFIEYVKNSTSLSFGGNVCYPYHPSACFVAGSELLWQPILVFLSTIGFLVSRRKTALALLPGFAWSLVMMFPFPLLLQKLATLNLLSGRYGRSVAWFVLIVLAGIGLNAIGNTRIPRWVLSTAVLAFLVWLATGLIIKTPSSLMAAQNHWIPLQGADLYHHPWIIAANLLALVLVFLPEKHWSTGKLAISLAALTLAGSLVFHSGFSVYWNCSNPELAPAIKSSVVPMKGRNWFPNLGMRMILPPNVSCSFAIRDIRYIAPLQPSRLEPLFNKADPLADLFQSIKAPVADFLGVNSAWRLKLEKKTRAFSLVNKPNPSPGPRAFWIANVKLVGSSKEAIVKALTNSAWKNTVFLDQTFKKNSTNNDVKLDIPPVPTHFLEDSANRIVLSVNAPHSGWLVLRDLYWPGWNAKVDGRTTRIYPADGIFRAVAIDKGRHKITFYYRPLSVVIGICLSLVTLVLCLLISLTGKRREENRHEP